MTEAAAGALLALHATGRTFAAHAEPTAYAQPIYGPAARTPRPAHVLRVAPWPPRAPCVYRRTPVRVDAWRAHPVHRPGRAVRLVHLPMPPTAPMPLPPPPAPAPAPAAPARAFGSSISLAALASELKRRTPDARAHAGIDTLIDAYASSRISLDRFCGIMLQITPAGVLKNLSHDLVVAARRRTGATSAEPAR